MSVVIIYMSLHGCAEKAAQRLRDMYWKDVELINLRFQDPPRLDNYNTVIIGGSIHSGEVQGKIKKFCQDNEWILLTKRLGIYLCHMYEGEAAIIQFNKAFSVQLRNHAVAKGLFGGEFNLEKMTPQEKSLVKAGGIKHSIENVNNKAIDGFGKIIFHLDKS